MKYNSEQAYSFLNAQIAKADDKNPLVVAIDGRTASGKTTFANRFASLEGVCIIHTDDFYKPRNVNGELEISEFDGNFDIDRFFAEVVKKLKSNDTIIYGVFDCKNGCIARKIEVKPKKCYIIEGAYSQNPNLGDYADIKIFFDIEKDIQKTRICKRNGNEAYERFSALWIPAEERYIKHYSINRRSDMIVNTEEN